MKRIFLTLSLLLASVLTTAAQAPEAIKLSLADGRALRIDSVEDPELFAALVPQRRSPYATAIVPQATDPATCNPGDVTFNTGSSRLKVCSAGNVWNTVASGTVVTSVSGSAPIVSSGGATPAISCPSCEVTTNKDALSGYAGLDASTRLKAAEFPAFTGDITTTAGGVVSVLKNTGTAGTYRSATFDAQGRETSGTNPTTFSGYAISDTSANFLAVITDKTGSGLVVGNNGPTFTTNVTVPLVIGGAAVGANAEIRSTSGVGTTDFIKFTVGNNGLTEAARFFDSGGFSVGTTVDPGAGIINALTGFRINNAAASGNVPRGNGTNFISAQLAVADLSGLPVTVPQGGSGLATLTSNAIYKGNGTGNILVSSLTDDGTTVTSTDTNILQSAVNPVLQLHATGGGAATADTFLGSFDGGGGTSFAGFSINRNPTSGVFTNTGKAHAQIQLQSTGTDASIHLATANANNVAATDREVIDKNGAFTLSPGARSSGVASYWTLNAPADTGQTAATESIGLNVVGSTRTWADGTVTTQREYLFQAPTYNKTTTSATFTKAATLAVSAAPTAGAGVTITNAYSIWAQAGLAQFDGGVNVASKFNVNSSGLPTQSNNITLAGQGNTLVVGVTSQKSETGAVDANVLTVSPGATTGQYRLRVQMSVSAATSGVIGWTATWTDSNGNAQTPTNLALFQSGTAAPALTFTTSAASNYYGDTVIDVNNANANIVIKWTGGGTTTAKMSAWLERIN